MAARNRWVFAGGGDRVGAIEEVARLGARLLLRTAIEAEVSAFLEQERYERLLPGSSQLPGPDSHRQAATS